MADELSINRIRQSMTTVENSKVRDRDINDTIEMARLTGNENNPRFVIAILRSAVRKGL